MAKAYVNKRDKFLWDNSFKPEMSIPVPTSSDEGKAIVVDDDGNYALGDVSTEDEIVYFKIDAQGENLIDCTMAQIKAALDDGSKTVCLMRINGTTKFILPLYVYIPLTGSVNYAEFTNCIPATYISKRRVNYETVKLDFANNTITYNEDSDYIGQNYSTTEHVVGTWIDGKPLYEITVEDTLSVSNSNRVLLTLGLNLTDKQVRNIVSCTARVSDIFVLDNGYNDGTGWKFVAYFNGGDLYGNAAWGNSPLTISLTFQYTKTTD